MKLFAALRKIRGFERERLPFLKSVIDFDILVEIGYAEEQKKPLTPKQLFLLELGSITTVRRKLAKLEEQGIGDAARQCGRSAFRLPVHHFFQPQDAGQVRQAADTHFSDGLTVLSNAARRAVPLPRGSDP